MSSQQQERPSLPNRRASRQNGNDLRTLPIPESTVLAGIRTYEKLGKLVETYDHNIMRKWSSICRKAENILNYGDLALREIANGNELTLTWAAQPTSIKMEIIKVLEDSFLDLRVARHSWVAEHVLRIKWESLRANQRTAAHKSKWRPYRAGSSQGSFEGGVNTVEGDALPSVTSSRDHLGVATSNLPPATNIDEAMAAYEARMNAKFASMVALLENRLPGTDSVAPPTLSPPAQPITRQRKVDDAFRQLTEKVDKRKQERKEKEALREAQALGRSNIGNDESSDQFDDESDDDTELDEAESFSRNPFLADTDEDLSPITKLPKIAGRGGRGSRSGAIQRGPNPRPLK
ncbi:hypothetical protein K3495_g13234 [Podosphaera aphanis]|nr:hypothetical protein K3495_g13234 [Podosphaera aphanis]